MAWSILAGADRMELENGMELRLLSALEVLDARREAAQLAESQEELDQLCPTCRAEAEQERCPGCGALIQASGVNPSFDMERFRRLKEGEGT